MCVCVLCLSQVLSVNWWTAASPLHVPKVEPAHLFLMESSPASVSPATKGLAARKTWTSVRRSHLCAKMVACARTSLALTVAAAPLSLRGPDVKRCTSPVLRHPA